MILRSITTGQPPRQPAMPHHPRLIRLKHLPPPWPLPGKHLLPVPRAIHHRLTHRLPAVMCAQLLFHNIRPVFVFDGGTPALKRRTLLKRRERRNAQANRLTATARRLLLNQLRRQRLQVRCISPILR